jgi:hypothetical protein
LTPPIMLLYSLITWDLDLLTSSLYPALTVWNTSGHHKNISLVLPVGYCETHVVLVLNDSLPLFQFLLDYVARQSSSISPKHTNNISCVAVKDITYFNGGVPIVNVDTVSLMQQIFHQ